MNTTLRTGPLLSAGLVIGTLALHACSREEATPAPTPDARYTTQGRVVMVPTKGSPASLLKIHHEAIPNFTDGNGRVVGMKSHAMDFPMAAEGVDAASLQVGQGVRFTFEVTWRPAPSWTITHLEVLPEDTRFAFEAGTPDEPTASTPDSHGG